MNDETISIAVNSAEQTTLVGRAFGSLFIRPIVLSQLPALRTTVISVYGNVNSGKGVFLAGCASSFSTKMVADIGYSGESWKPDLKKSWLIGKNIFRHCDYAPFFSTEKTPEGIRPRKMIPSAGVDFLEHPRFSHIEAGAIVIIRAPFANGPSEQKYAAELYSMLSAASEEATAHSHTQASKFIETVFSEKIHAGSVDTRFVHIALTIDHEFARNAFDDFRCKAKEMTLTL